MNLEEIEGTILEKVKNKLNDENITNDEKWVFIESALHLLGHYNCEEKNKNPDLIGIHYYGTPEEFKQLKDLILEIE